jgi:hypothetical protein
MPTKLRRWLDEVFSAISRTILLTQKEMQPLQIPEGTRLVNLTPPEYIQRELIIA